MPNFPEIMLSNLVFGCEMAAMRNNNKLLLSIQNILNRKWYLYTLQMAAKKILTLNRSV